MTRGKKLDLLAVRGRVSREAPSPQPGLLSRDLLAVGGAGHPGSLKKSPGPEAEDHREGKKHRDNGGRGRG